MYMSMYLLPDNKIIYVTISKLLWKQTNENTSSWWQKGNCQLSVYKLWLVDWFICILLNMSKSLM